MASFEETLTENVKACSARSVTNNHDFRRYSRKKPIGQNAKKLMSNSLLSMGFFRFGSRQQLWNNIDKLAWLYERLDDKSKDVLIDVLTYRVLGEKYMRLPTNTPEYWYKLDELDRMALSSEELRTHSTVRSIRKINLADQGYPLEVFTYPSAIYSQWILQQYRCESNDSIIQVEEGDVVVDGGGCYGDTALYFSLKAGPSGNVYSWEFMPENIDVFKHNMALNPQYSQRVELVESPLWSKSGKEFYVIGAGPSARISSEPPGSVDATIVRTYTIDDLYNAMDLESIDFVKMDIEGAELPALAGARKTLERCRPRLAIAVYHNLRDFWEIPQWIDSLDLGYKFHLRHYSIHSEETVLFAEVKV